MDSYNAFFLFVVCIFIFYSRKKAFLRLWHDSFTAVEKHFYSRKNKFCCWAVDRMQACIR
jgi:hypothetical protein